MYTSLHDAHDVPFRVHLLPIMLAAQPSTTMFYARLTRVAVGPGPTLQAGLVAVVVAGVVAEEFVPGPAELVAAEAVVVLVTADPDLVLELGHGAVVRQLLPVGARVDHARM